MPRHAPRPPHSTDPVASSPSPKACAGMACGAHPRHRVPGRLKQEDFKFPPQTGGFSEILLRKRADDIVHCYEHPDSTPTTGKPPPHVLGSTVSFHESFQIVPKFKENMFKVLWSQACLSGESHLPFEFQSFRLLVKHIPSL